MDSSAQAEPTQSKIPRRFVVLGIILLVAFGLRSCHLTNHLASPLGHIEEASPYTDMGAFSTWAKQIADGDWLGEDTFHPYMDWMGFGPGGYRIPLEQFEAWWGGKEVYHQNPLFPYLLAVSYAVTGSAVPLLVLQVLLSSLSLILVYDLGRRLLDVRAGLVAAGIAALFAPAVVLDAIVLRSSLNASITLLSLWLLLRLKDRGTGGLALGTGACLAASYMLRPTGLLLLLLGPLLLLLDRQTRGRWKAWLPTLVAGIVVVIGPFAARNVTVGAPLLKFSTRGAETVIHANVYGVDPGFMSLPGRGRFIDLMNRGHGSLTDALSASMDTWPPSPPASWSWHVWQKIVCVFSDYEYSNNINFYYFRRASPLLEWLPTFGWFAGLALVGMVLLAWRGRQRQAALIVLVGAGALFVGCLLGFAMGRYRMPLAILLTIPAGATVSFAVTWLTQKRMLPATITILAALSLTLLSLTVTPKYAYSDKTGSRQIQEGRARQLKEEGHKLRDMEYALAANLMYVEGQGQAASEMLVAYLEEYTAFLKKVEEEVDQLDRGQQAMVRYTIPNQAKGFLNSIRFVLGGVGNQAGTDQVRQRTVEIERIIERIDG